ncbi:transcriptional regulator GcvA [Phreatobacter sp.]|uniref:transcriptional regulator GcvA n=1 Tax=Phreatobacter sp. TaxID=1966341 RepID=UPI003F7188C9
MSKKRYDLPPLDFIQGFEAAARHLSFTRAARELFLTQSAVSRQIKTLEEALETHLFERRHRSLALTDDGRAFYDMSVEVLNRVQQSIDQMKRRRATNQLAVTTTTGFASLWLIPRLNRFTRTRPEIEVRIVANDRTLNLDRSLIDVAIRYMPANAVPPDAETLFGEAIQPVCSPALVADNAAPLRRPEDLKSHTLLHLDYGPAHKTWYDWGTWLTSFGLDDLRPAGTLHFTRYDQMIQAAIAGQGVALGLSPLIDEQIRTGQLVAAFEKIAPSSKAYVLMLARAAAGRPEVAAFCDWLREEAREEAREGNAAAPAAGQRPSR